jgi:hypothetical protein
LSDHSPNGTGGTDTDSGTEKNAEKGESDLDHVGSPGFGWSPSSAALR